MSGARFIKLTDPSGGTVWVVAQWVTKVQEARSGEYATRARAIVSMGGSSLAVVESAEEVVRLMEAMDAG
jgi:hypothetical protein